MLILGSVTKKISQDQYSQNDIISIACTCRNTDELLAKLKISKEDVTRIEQATVGQNSNPLWKRLRKGRLTASNFYRVHTKVESVKCNPSTDCSKLVCSLLDPPEISHLPQIQRGHAAEREAANKLIELLHKTHMNIHVTECGLYLSVERSYLGASPDGVVTCECCQPTLLEIKCPTLELDSLTYLDNNKQLKKNTSYYGQVQGQMAITGIHKTYFFVYCSDSVWQLQIIDYDQIFTDSMLNNLDHFFRLYMIPALISEPPSKRKKEVITREEVVVIE
jgi:hypothetical protein